MGTINLKNKRILVTGGNGYLGTFLVKALRSEGAEVFVISNNVTPSTNNFSVNITNFEELNTIVQKIQPDIIYHLAANISRNRDFSIYESMTLSNVTGTLNVLQAVKNINYTNFIFTSSSEIYGNNVSPLNEKQHPKPVSPYSLSKASAELLIQTFSNLYNKNYTNLRIFNFYGKNMSEEFFIPQMVNSLKRGQDFLMTKGAQMRDFLYVDDVVAALLLAATNTNAYNETFNVCSGKGTKLSDLATAVNEQIKGNAKVILGAIPYRDNEVWEMIGDNSKIKEKLGFIPQVNLENGVKNII